MEHPLVTRAIENAQKRVESRNAEIRRHLLEYDDVMNRQRDVVYTLRDAIMSNPDLKPLYGEMAGSLTDAWVKRYTGVSRHPEEWDWDGLIGEFQLVFLADVRVADEDRRRITPEALEQLLTEVTSRRYDERKEELGEGLFADLCRYVFLRTIDTRWREHLYALDMVREGIGLRAYGQKDPLVEYKQESFRMFEEMTADFYREALALLFRAQVQAADETRRPAPRRVVHAYKPAAAGEEKEEAGRPAQVRRAEVKVGRNDPCPCGSGKKYKKCCGRNA
jgi:preprotein translocase subunit SecA